MLRSVARYERVRRLPARRQDSRHPAVLDLTGTTAGCARTRARAAEAPAASILALTCACYRRSNNRSSDAEGSLLPDGHANVSPSVDRADFIELHDIAHRLGAETVPRDADASQCGLAEQGFDARADRSSGAAAQRPREGLPVVTTVSICSQCPSWSALRSQARATGISFDFRTVPHTPSNAPRNTNHHTRHDDSQRADKGKRCPRFC
jgi:hypothetical protein